MRKITKYRAYSALLATAISLTGCSSQSQKFENSQEKIVYCSEEPLEKEKTKVDITQNNQNPKADKENSKSSQNPYINVLYEESFDTIAIIGKKKKHHQFNQLSDEFYQKLNSILKEKNITNLYFKNLDNTFNLSKIDFSNITELEFDTYSGIIDLKENDLSDLEEVSFSNCTGTFDGIDAPILQFSNTPLKFIKPYILKHDTSKTKIYWSEDGKKKRNLKALLECLVENNINIEQLDIYEGNSQDYNGMTKEEFDLLSKLKVKYIDISDEGVKKPLHLDLTLNKSIRQFSIRSYHRSKGKDSKYGELGNIKIRTNNKQFDCNFSYMDITENTHFSLPDSTWISFSSLECRDISAFDELSNVSYLWLKEDLGLGFEADNNGAIAYCKDSSHKFVNIYTNEIVEPFREYNEFLNYLKMCKQLENVKEKLNISKKEDNKYENIISIGDVVNLKKEDTPVYRALDSNKSTTSYYGTSELRCIRSISLAKGEQQIEVDNMKDYEVFTKLGFAVEKYNLVNQYSLNADGSLNTECYCNKGGVQLVYTPFHHKK